MAYQHLKVPDGEKISVANGKANVPDHPVIPFIEGDGTGRDIWRASVRVLDAAVAKAYGGKRKLAWMEVYAGEKSSTNLARGCSTKRLKRSKNIWSASRAAHHTHRRRDSITQRGIEKTARPLRLRAPGALVQGCAVSG